jgi:hypothetical protein
MAAAGLVNDAAAASSAAAVRELKSRMDFSSLESCVAFI